MIESQESDKRNSFNLLILYQVPILWHSCWNQILIWRQDFLEYDIAGLNITGFMHVFFIEAFLVVVLLVSGRWYCSKTRKNFGLRKTCQYDFLLYFDERKRCSSTFRLSLFVNLHASRKFLRTKREDIYSFLVTKITKIF